MSEHRIPAIDRALEVLDILSQHAGMRITALSEQLEIPRSTVYRILNSLEAGGVVTSDGENGYHLGPKLLRWASTVSQGLDLVDLARSHLDRLAAEQAATVKLSVLDTDMALVVAVAEGPGRYSISTQVGSRFPLHAGAASKVLLAHADAALQDEVLGRELSPVTSSTMTSPEAVFQILPDVVTRGYATDHGEYVEGINAVAAPVFGPLGQCVAAISIPYLAAAGEAREAVLRDAVTAAAAALTREIGGYSRMRDEPGQ